MKIVLALSIALAVTASLIPSNVFASEEDIVGTYTLVGATYKYVDTGEVVNSYGEHPKGYITYGREGRMFVLITYDPRPKPSDPLKTSIEERDALYRSMTAYGGTYTYRDGRMDHHVDISWDETRSGTTVTRRASRDGDRLTYVTEPFATRNGKTPGRMVIQTLVWEKMK